MCSLPEAPQMSLPSRWWREKQKSPGKFRGLFAKLRLWLLYLSSAKLAESADDVTRE